MGFVVLYFTMTKYPAQNSGIDNSLHIFGSPGAKMCGQGWGQRVFCRAFKSQSDLLGVVMVEFSKVIGCLEAGLAGTAVALS